CKASTSSGDLPLTTQSTRPRQKERLYANEGTTD
ncbi:hypothetical protein E5Q_04670, partial [Mixia osmundae IAM 14324]